MEHLVDSANILMWIGFFVGSCLGSFLNVVAYRVPRGVSVVRPGSNCPSCKTPISWFFNLPVLGWIILKGKASCCGSRISIRYPLVEILIGVLFAWQFLLHSRKVCRKKSHPGRPHQGREAQPGGYIAGKLRKSCSRFPCNVSS